MNKTYRSIWNEALGAWVAVSEIETAKGKPVSGGVEKTGGAKPRVRLLLRLIPLIIGMTFGLSSQVAYAQTDTCTNNRNDVFTNILCGPETQGSNNQSVAVGARAKATGIQSVAIGADTVAAGTSSVAIGGDDLVQVSEGTAALYKKLTGDDLVVPGSRGEVRYPKTTAAEGAVAVGVSAQAKELATAFGARTKASGISSLALGVGSTADKENSVAIGAGSSTVDVTAASVTGTALNAQKRALQAGETAAYYRLNLNGVDFDFKAGNSVSEGDIVSFGSAGFERQLKFVAPGNVSEDSTDAINGSQLYSVVDALTALRGNVNTLNDKQTHFYSIGQGLSSEGNYNNDGATGSKALAAGIGASATHMKTTAVGTNSTATADAALAIGNDVTSSGGAAVAVGSMAKAEGAQAVAIGQRAEARAAWDISIGRNAGASPVTAVPEGRNIAIGDGALKYGNNLNNNIAMGTDTGTGLNGAGNVILGTYTNAAQAIDSAVNAGTTEAQMGVQSVTATLPGSTNTATIKALAASNSVAIGSRAIAINLGSVALGQMAKGLGATTVAVGNGSRSLGSNTVAVGNTANAGAAGAIAIGQHANYQQATSSYGITGPNSIAVGVKTNSSATRSIAIGTEALVEKATVTGGKIYDKAGTEYNASVAGSLLTGENSIAIGAFSVVRGTNAAAIGQASEAVGQNSFAGGNDVHAIGKSSLALGDGARSENDSTIAIGYVARSTHQNSTAIGNDAQSSATGALAIGKGTRATGTGNVVLGVDSKGETASVVAIGNTSLANQENSVAIGNKATAQGTGNVAIGTNSGNVDTKTYSGTVGSNTVFVGVDAGRNATGNQGQVAVGWQAGQGSIGTFNVASGYQAGQFINGSNNVAIGKQAGQGTGVPRVSASDTVAIGTETKATANNAIAIGKGAQATGLQSISIGVGNIVSGANSGALGDPSHITGIGTYAIGNDNGSADNPIAADNAGVFGNLNRMTADADNSRAIGNYNHITTDSTYVLGSGINSDPAGNTLGVTVANSVYLGNDSQVAGGAANAAGTLFNTDILNTTGSTTSAGATGTVSSAMVNNITYEGFAGQTAVGAVTVGAAGSERRIQNVAAGEISETSTDAINGSQLYFVVEKLQDAQTHYYSVNDGGSQGANYDNKGATGLNAMAAGVAAQATAVNTTAVGHLASASADNATVLGNEATATAKDTVAIGQSSDALADSAVAVGKNAQGAGNFAVSIGLDSKATNDGAVAMGSGSAAEHTYTVAIGNDAKALQDGATALGRLAKAEAEKSLALGTESQVTSLKGIAIGVDAKALGGTTGTTKTGNIAIGNAAQTESNDSVVIGTNAQATVSAENAVVIGKNAAANNGGGNNSVAIGKDAVVTADGSIALGEEAKATAFTTTAGVSVPAAGMITAIGYKASGSGMGSVALGSNASTTQNAVYSVAIGNGATAGSTDASGAALRGGRYGVAVGNSAKAIADNSAAFGPSAQAQNTGSLALGHSAIASVDSGVALGANSLADVAGGMVGADPLLAASDKNNSTWTSSALYGAVSVGSSAHGITRQITNLAAGTADTDAVNVAQLKAAGFNLATSVSDGQLVDNTDAAADKKVQNGETVTVDAGKNIKITQNANTISVATKDDVSFTTVTVQDAQGNKTVLNADGVTITPDGGKIPVSLTSSGLNNGGNVISNVANGLVAQGSTEAVTGDQLYAIQQQLNNSVGSVNQGLSFTGNSGNFNRKMGENTTIKGSLANDAAASSSNIRTVADSTGNIEIMLANAPTFTGKVTAQGLDAGGQKITNVQKGSDNADAVNVEQLQDAIKNVAVATQNVINANSPFSYVNSQGEMLHRSVNPDGSVTFKKSADGTPYTGSDISIAALNAQAPQSTTPTTLGNIEAGTKTNDAVNVSQLQGAITALGGNAAINSDGTIKAPVYSITGTTGAVATVSSVGDALTALNTEVTKALTFSGDNSDEKVERKLGTGLAVKGGATGNLTDGNIGVTGSAADNSLLIKLAEKINLGEAGSLQTGATTVNNSGITVQALGKQAVSLTSDGLNNGNNKITNVADGVASGDAVNKGQLDNVQAIAEVKTKVSEGTGISVSNKGTAEEPDYEVALSSATQASLAKADSALQSFTTSVNGNEVDTINQANNNVSFVNGTGTIARADGSNITFDVNKSGLTMAADGTVTAEAAGDNFATAEQVAAAINSAATTTELTSSVEAGNNTHVSSKVEGNNTVYTVSADKATVSVSAALSKTESTITAADGTVTTDYAIDLSKATKDDIAKGVAASDTVASKGLTFAADSGSTNEELLGSTVAVNGDSNISTEAEGDRIAIKLKDDIKVNSVTATEVAAGAVKVGDTVTIGSSGIDAGNTVITNVAAGKAAGDAVNVSQLTPIAQALGVTVNSADGTVAAPSLVVTKADGSKYDGSTTIQGALDNIGTEIQKPINFAGNSGSVAKKLSEIFTIKGALADSAKASSSNIRTKVDNGEMVIELAESPKFGEVTINDNGKITGVTSGDVAQDSKEAVNGGQLYAQGEGVKNIIGGTTVYNPDTGTYTNADIGGTGKGNINDAIAAVKATADAGWNLTAQGANSSKVGAGETVDLRNTDGNITVAKSTDADTVTFDLADAISVDSVKAGDTIVNNDGVKVGDSVSLASDGLTVGDLAVSNGKISGLEAGSDDKDAVNVAQLKSAAAASANKVAAGDNIKVAETKNADGSTTYTVATAKDLVVDSVKAGDTTVNTDGVKVGDSVSLASGGLKAGDLTVGSNGKISGLEAGSDDKDAVNVAQLKATAAASANKVAAGDNIKVSEEQNADGSTTYTVATAKDLVVDSVKAGNTTVNNEGVKVGDKVALASDGLTVGDLAVSNGKISGLEAGSDDKDAVNVAQLKSAAAASANKVAAGDNIKVAETKNADGSTTYTVATAKDLVVDSVKAGNTTVNNEGVKVGDSVSLASDGLKAGDLTVGTNGKISGLENGSIAAGSKEAVNGGQLYGTANSVANALGGGSVVNADGTVSAPAYTIIDPATGNSTVAGNVGDALTQLNSAVNSPLTFAGDSGSNVERKLGTTVNLKGGATGNLTDNNIAVVANGTDTLSIKLAETVNLGSNGSVTTGQTVLNNDGVKVGDKVALTSDGLKAGDVNITSAGIDAGNTQISGVKAGEQDSDAVNVAQLKAAAAASANKVAAGDNIEVAETKNADGSTTYTVATAKDVSFDSVTAGTGANRVVLDDAGVSVGGNTYISGNGINANNQKVTNVAAGNVAAGSTDAVNGGQLYNTAASIANVFGGNATVNPDGSVSMSNIGGTGANNVNDAIKAVNQAAVEAKTTVSAGDNIVVAQSTNADGSTNYTVSTAKDLVVDSVKAGDTTLNGNGLSITGGPSITAGGVDMGGKKITNVADGEISATSKDAVNGSQLYQAYQVLGGNTNAINTITAPATENADGTTTPAGTVVTVVTNPDGTKTTTTETNQTVAVSTDKGGNQYTLTTYNVEGQNTYVTNDVIQAIGKMNEQGIKFFHTNDGVVEPVVQGHNTEDSSASGAYATAIGYQSVASGEGAVAMGNTYTASTQIDGAQVTEVKDASGNVTGYAQSTVASGTRAIAMGTGSQALAEDSIAIGTGNVVTGKQSGAIGDPTVVTGDSAYSIGNNNTVSADNAYALGSNIKATLANSVYLGDNASATAVHTTAGGGNYTFAGANDDNVAGVADAVGVVSVGTEGETRQIQNVAAGVVSATSTDAINGSQLHYTNEAINNVANYTVNMGNQLNQRIDDVENRSNAGAATAMAVAGLPQAYMPGKSMVAVAGGVYRGESGYAVGYSSISDNGNWVIKGSATGNSRGHYGATAGVGYQW